MKKRTAHVNAGSTCEKSIANCTEKWNMTSLPMRDQVEDHLLTPENSALLIIDFQPLQVASVASMDRGELVRNIVSLAKAAKLYGMPIVPSTVNL